ncbi:crossover junction endonuclease MUS81 [Cryptococcus gattii Ru294]|nr:crossover junction endonuclease MUS81 [Cryptococcus gattii Ru294]
MPPRKKCGNPLFLQWMEEIRDAAREKGSKSAETYSKACRSLELCPVTYGRPRDLAVLAHIGEKTIAQLENRWIEYRKIKGLDVPAEPEKPKTKGKGKGRAAPDDDVAMSGTSQETVKKTRRTTAKAYIPIQGSGAYGILLALILAVDRPEVTTQVFLTKSEIIRTAQEYCDTSFEHSEKGTYFTAWSGMKTLVNKGYVYVTGNPHKHCLTEEGYDVALAIRNLRPEFSHMKKHPFSHAPAPGTSNRVTEFPTNRAITALDLYNGPSIVPATLSTEYVPPVNAHSSPASRVASFDAVASKLAAGERFSFWYITPSGSRTPLMTSAHLRLDPEQFVNLRRIEFKYSQRNHPFAAQLRLMDNPTTAKLRDKSGVPTLYAYLIEADAPPKCSMFDTESNQSRTRAGGKDNASNAGSSPLGSSPAPISRTRIGLRGRNDPCASLSDGGSRLSAFISEPSDPFYFDVRTLALQKRPSVPSGNASTSQSASRSTSLSRLSSGSRPPLDENPYNAILGQGPSVPPISTLSRTITVPASTSQPRTSSLSTLNISSSSSVPSVPKRSYSSAAVLPSRPIAPTMRPRLSNHVPNPTPAPEHFDDAVIPVSDRCSIALPSFTISDAIIFPPGSYDIILIIDTREVESSKTKNRDKIAETLEAKGIRVETRALRLGDMCWVARRKDGLGGEEDECVLDYVAERKRLDDLVYSIKDGRYTEQCFRLSNACLNNVYYIVEDWQVSERMEQSGLAIMTVKSQVQVHNRFFLKETHTLNETIDFLATMTRVIVSSHSTKALYVIPTRFLSRPSFKPLQDHLQLKHPDTKFHTSFIAYQELNDKSASQTLKEKFAKMMMCVKGMSAEKVSALLDEWDTPRAMWEDMKERDRQPDDLEPPGESRGKKRKIGKGLFFAERVQGEGRRKIGDALSESLWTALMG